MPAAATSQIKHITNASPSLACSCSSFTRSPTTRPAPSVLVSALLFRLKRLEMCQQSDKFRTNYAAATNDDDDDNKGDGNGNGDPGPGPGPRSRPHPRPVLNKRRRNYYCIKWNY